MPLIPLRRICGTSCQVSYFNFTKQLRSDNFQKIMNCKIEQFNHIFLNRIRNGNFLISALWLFIYTFVPVYIFGALFVLITYNYVPGIYATIGEGAGQKNLNWFSTLIFNPLIESILLGGIIQCGVRLKAGATSIIIGALCVALIHSLQNLSWGATVFCFFLIQSYTFFKIYRTNLLRSYGIISFAHSLHNALLLIAIFMLNKTV